MPQAQQLGRYQLLDRIAFGGMAEIFRAKTFDQDGREHMVAVKRVLHHLTNDDDFIKMIVDEAKLTALLRHENIAQVYEFAHAGEEYFIAMEYIDGKDVRMVLERHRAKQTPVPAEHAAWIIMEIAHALNAAHTQRDKHGRAMHIVHRDVSPSNILCSYNGEVKLCDFGIAKATLTRTQTKTGVIKGKVKYMSPEQAMGRRLDHRSDLFSLGTVLYEMLTLEAPFQAATEVELIFAVRDAQKRDAKSLVPTIPDELNEILNKLMQRSRSQRFQSGEELALALRVFLDRYKPSYRRSNCGRFMRREFGEDIEKELRLLEEYVIAGGDVTKMGENLIADALGPDAPYTKFTAALPEGDGKTPLGNSDLLPDSLPPLEDLHAQSTRILSLPDPRLETADPSDLHAQSTRILGMPGRPGIPDKSPLGPLHDLETRILTAPAERPQDSEEETTAARGGHKAPLHDLETKILSLPESRPLAELSTKILRFDERPSARPIDPNDPPKVVVSVTPDGAEPSDDDELTTVPLQEDDLEPA
jgi:eukaryotic-like serine/threonine-protein kinase